MLGMTLRWMLVPASMLSFACTTDTGEVDSNGGTTGEPMYCPGVPEWGYPLCRTQADCEQEFALCVAAPDDCPGPGCNSDCTANSDCADFLGPGMNGVCTFPYTGCCALEGVCAAPCDETTCAADQTCEADGLCTPIPCDGGYACAAGFTCTPGAATADGHGCAAIPCDEPDALPCGPTSECMAGTCQRIACSSDADCPCGSCIQQQCWERPWVCDEGNA
jgi:hypothetical protein